MAEEFAVGVATNVTKSFSSRIWREIKYVIGYNNNIKKLREKVTDLEVREDAIKLEVDAARTNAEIIGPDVSRWLKKVDNIKIEANEVLKRTMNAQWDCLYCKCPKIHSRYKLSKQALMKISEVNELQDASNFGRIGHPAPRLQMPWTSPQEFDGFGSRVRIVNDVMEALKDNSITIIGICGMAGVGKTTLVKQIADKVKDTKLFDEVAMAVVSNDPSVSKIQDELAENLGLRIEEKTDRSRGERLYSRLMNKEEKILIILDDLWQELGFRNIGIPVAGEREGLKVLLTSRYKGVCDKMRARPFEVEVLSKQESWLLFKETAEISDEANYAKEVNKECRGLPLAIVIVAKALKNKEDYVWRDALAELKEASVTNSIPDMDELVNSRIMLSYNKLADNTKLLLLLCSLFPEDYNIPLEVLVRYAKGLQLFENITMARTRDKVYSITDGLKSCYLLLAGDEEYVKLHDVVRDFCLSIPSSDKHKYMVRHGGLKEWPQEDSYAPYTAISLTFDEIDELSSGLDCPKLNLLRLNFREDELHIPEEFFKGMNELKVLELRLKGELLSSLQSLVNLRTLCFDNCKLYGGISIIGSLRKLEVLSFYNSHLDHFPDEIVELINLKSLDLRFEMGPPLPSGVLLRLKKLEELYLGSYFQEWERKGVEAYSGIITEISSLQNLQSIQFCVYDDHCLEKVLENLHPEKLTSFNITRTTYDEGVTGFQFRKVLTLDSVNVDLLSKHEVQTLLWETEDLTLTVKGLTNMINELDVKGFVYLKKLNMQDCDLKYLVDVTDFHTNGGTFINLEELVISYANNLEELCHGNLPVGSFAYLRILKIQNCGSIRSIFLQSSLECLRQLQEISIRWCPMLETLVSNDKEDEKNTRDIEFPQLEILDLYQSKSFRSFSPDSGHETFFGKVMLPNLKTLQINDVDGIRIRCMVDDQVPIGSLSKLQTMKVELAKSLEVVFDFTGLNVEGANIENLLGQLESLKLKNLPNLKHIWRMLPKGIHAFRKLRSLIVGGLNNLRYLLSPSMATVLVGLETLELEHCEEMEAIIGRDERPILEIESEEAIIGRDERPILEIESEEAIIGRDEIVFPKLRSISIGNLKNFQMLWSENIDLELPLLTILKIEKCPKFNLYHCFSSKVMFPNLNTLEINGVDGIRCIVDDQVPIGTLSKLQTLGVNSCTGLQHVAASESIKRLQSLESLMVGWAESLEVVFDFTGVNVKGANIENLLGRLESLELRYLPNLKHIWRMLPEGIHAFKNLRSLKVWGLDNLTYLLSPSMAKMLVGLETLYLRRCEEMEAIIGRDERPILDVESEEDIVKGKDGEDSTNKIVFPKLRSISIKNLNNFRMLCSENVDLKLPPLTTLEIDECPKFDLYHYFSTKAFTLVNLETLYIKGQNIMSYIMYHQMPIGPFSKLRTINVNECLLLQSLERLEVHFCESIEAVFDFRGINVEEADMESLLDRLQSLELSWLPNLKHIWRTCPKEIHAFKNLRSLQVENCGNLRYLLSPSMAKMLVGLEDLSIIDCYEMEAVIGRDERVVISEIEYEEDSVKKKDGEETTHKIQFPKLRSITITNLENFRMLCSENVDLELPSLAELILENCPEMTKFCVGQLNATRLHCVQVEYYLYDEEKYVEKNVALADFNSWLKDCESKIRCLKCSFYGTERCTHFG